MAETIMVTENVFSKEDCERIIKAMPKARKHIYQKANDMSRQDIQLDGEIVFAEVAHEDMLAKSNNINLMRKLIETLHSAIEVYAEKFPIIKEFHLETCQVTFDGWKVQETKVGQGFHKWHFEDANTRERFLTWSVFLNNIEEGGETEFLYQNIRIPAKQGSLCLFPSDWTHLHRGNPPISNDKYIMTGWYNYYLSEELI